MEEFDLPAAYEASGARPLGRRRLDESRRYAELGRAATAKIADAEDREHMEADFATIEAVTRFGAVRVEWLDHTGRANAVGLKAL